VVLLSNIQRAGLVYAGKRYQATYAARLDESGRMTALAAHSWAGWLALQGEAGIEAAALLAMRSSARAVIGLLGPWAAVSRVRDALGRPAAQQLKDVLFGLQLAELQVPALLQQSDVRVRTSTPDEAREVLAPWGVEYEIEVMNAERGPELEQRVRERLVAAATDGLVWLLEVGGRMVSMSAINGVAHGIVQVGGVYTPPRWRGRGYARAVVAGLLLNARAVGASRSILFTGATDLAAQRAYRALGYVEVGDYGVLIFDG
jgi:predicted GNAT family acetyltransferase